MPCPFQYLLFNELHPFQFLPDYHPQMLSIRRAALRALSGPRPCATSTNFRSVLSIQSSSPSLLVLPTQLWTRRAYSDDVSHPSVASGRPGRESFQSLDSVEDALAADSPPRSSGPRAPNNILYVGNILFETTEETLRESFGEYGRVERVKLIEDARGYRRGFGYVYFASVEEATAAKAMNGQRLEGRTLNVDFAGPDKYQRSQPPPRSRQRQFEDDTNPPNATLFVGNLAFETSDEDLRDLFSQTKNVIDIRVQVDRQTGKPRGFAHADFASQEDADAAKQWLATQSVRGRQLRVTYGRPLRSRWTGPRDGERESRKSVAEGTETAEASHGQESSTGPSEAGDHSVVGEGVENKKDN